MAVGDGAGVSRSTVAPSRHSPAILHAILRAFSAQFCVALLSDAPRPLLSQVRLCRVGRPAAHAACRRPRRRRRRTRADDARPRKRCSRTSAPPAAAASTAHVITVERRAPPSDDRRRQPVLLVRRRPPAAPTRATRRPPAAHAAPCCARIAACRACRRGCPRPFACAARSRRTATRTTAHYTARGRAAMTLNHCNSRGWGQQRMPRRRIVDPDGMPAEAWDAFVTGSGATEAAQLRLLAKEKYVAAVPCVLYVAARRPWTARPGGAIRLGSRVGVLVCLLLSRVRAPTSAASVFVDAGLVELTHASLARRHRPPWSTRVERATPSRSRRALPGVLLHPASRSCCAGRGETSALRVRASRAHRTPPACRRTTAGAAAAFGSSACRAPPPSGSRRRPRRSPRRSPPRAWSGSAAASRCAASGRSPEERLAVQKQVVGVARVPVPAHAHELVREEHRGVVQVLLQTVPDHRAELLERRAGNARGERRAVHGGLARPREEIRALDRARMSFSQTAPPKHAGSSLERSNAVLPPAWARTRGSRASPKFSRGNDHTALPLRRAARVWPLLDDHGEEAVDGETPRQREVGTPRHLQDCACSPSKFCGGGEGPQRSAAPWFCERSTATAGASASGPTPANEGGGGWRVAITRRWAVGSDGLVERREDVRDGAPAARALDGGALDAERACSAISRAVGARRASRRLACPAAARPPGSRRSRMRS